MIETVFPTVLVNCKSDFEIKKKLINLTINKTGMI